MHKPNQIPGIADNYSARIMLTIENGKVVSERMIGAGEILATFDIFIELAQRAGWHVTPNHDEVTKSHATAEEVAHVA
ncbi:hypothetical protein [Serratia marcescens]|uniref:Uncharacterized protein n=1 Tax=Serratia marcescens TaxID=615 RepID=A0ABD6HWK8_SERMA|nr:hypothetical protein [Serratia marcescens]MDT0205767.1 hypothetical protein [Serratia marcescens]MVF06061.1 hypothetical protein [Serratia marcescens]